MATRRWKRESTHGNECRQCNEAAANAKTNAILNGAQSLYMIHTDAGMTFEFGHRQHDNKYALYVMTYERTQG